MNTAADAVSAYLDFIANGTEAAESDERSLLESALAAAETPADTVAIRAKLSRLGDKDGTRRRAAFVANAKQWANGTDAPLDAIVEILAADGVDQATLRDAGLIGSSSSSPSKRTRVGRDAILAALPKGNFTKKDLVAASGASIGTVTKAIQDLLGAGELLDAGPDPDWAGRGRVPTLYRRA